MTVPSLAFTEPVGPDTAPLLVLGPSLGTSTILWENVIPALARSYRVIAWDLPGHGASAPARDPFTVGEIADAVADAMGSGPDRSFYAGVSLGGAVGLELLLRHPALVDGAAIVASGAQMGEATAWRERAAQVRAQSTSSVIVASAERWFAPGSIEREPQLSGRLLHALQDADDESYALCCEALAEFDVRERLGEIGAPVLAAWGEHDAVAPEAKSLEIAFGVRYGTAVRIDAAGHLPPAECPEATTRAILDFFDGLTRMEHR
ncbi:alpha/beta fold hydrolase [Microbacterium deminutum]|uniref:AB hydrolase-1 domain-containing protein n=1 Tax=Microbacterium deminutum TaxID=344164 RepID=A0ABN2QY74_9MICO